MNRNPVMLTELRPKGVCKLALKEMTLKIEASKIYYLAGSREGKSNHLRYSTSHQQISLFRVSN